MNKADTILAAMNLRQRYRAKRSELLAYNFSVPTFRGCLKCGARCVIHESWKPGNDWKRVSSVPNGAAK